MRHGVRPVPRQLQAAPNIVTTAVPWSRHDPTPEAPPLDEDARVRGADFPAVLAVLGVRGVVRPDRLERTVAAAELDPSGPRGGGTPCVGIRGATPVAVRAERAGLDLIVALDDGAAAECGRTIAAETAEEVVDILAGRREPEEPPPGSPDGPADPPGPIWESPPKRCGSWRSPVRASPHSPRGRVGRDSPARYGRVTQRMLPDLDTERSRETTRIHSVLGLMRPGLARIVRPPPARPTGRRPRRR